MNLISYTHYWYSTTEVILILQHSVLIEQLIRKLPFYSRRNAVHHIVSPNSNFEYQKFCPIKRQWMYYYHPNFKKTFWWVQKHGKIRNLDFGENVWWTPQLIRVIGIREIISVRGNVVIDFVYYVSYW